MDIYFQPFPVTNNVLVIDTVYTLFHTYNYVSDKFLETEFLGPLSICSSDQY